MNVLNMSDVLFEYKHTLSFGYVGMPGGGSIVVLSDGSILHRNFTFGNEEPTAEDKIAFMPEIAVLIEKVLISHKADLKKISSNLNNGSLDGSHDSFQFGKKKISSWNISRTDLSEVKQKNPDYYQEYQDNMIQENRVLDIYNEIISILNEFGIGLELKKK